MLDTCGYTYVPFQLFFIYSFLMLVVWQDDSFIITVTVLVVVQTQYILICFINCGACCYTIPYILLLHSFMRSWCLLLNNPVHVAGVVIHYHTFFMQCSFIHSFSILWLLLLYKTIYIFFFSFWCLLLYNTITVVPVQFLTCLYSLLDHIGYMWEYGHISKGNLFTPQDCTILHLRVPFAQTHRQDRLFCHHQQLCHLWNSSE